MKFTLIDQKGNVKSVLEVPTLEALAINTPQGWATVAGEPPFAGEGKYVNGLWRQRDERPSKYHEWDDQTETWVDTQTLEDAKRDKLRMLKDERRRAEGGGFVWNGLTFDSDERSQSRIQSAVTGALIASKANKQFSVTWTLKDNSERTLDIDEMIAVGLALSVHISGTHSIYSQLKSAVKGASTINEVNDIKWP